MVNPTESDVLAAIRAIAARELRMTREILPAHELIGDLELDSISLVTMLAELENQFWVHLPPADSEALRTVQDLVARVVEHSGAPRP
jgi:acyl carrier protein